MKIPFLNKLFARSTRAYEPFRPNTSGIGRVECTVVSVLEAQRRLDKCGRHVVCKISDKIYQAKLIDVGFRGVNERFVDDLEPGDRILLTFIIDGKPAHDRPGEELIVPERIYNRITAIAVKKIETDERAANV